jgi:3-oxoacid CoA-transferase subunit B
LKHCTLPLTGAGVVDLVITELAVFTLERGNPDGMTLIELAPGVTADEVKAKTDADYSVALA